MRLPDPRRKSGLSLAFVQALASHAGLIFRRTGDDDFGVDGELKSLIKLPSGRLLENGPALEIQMKATVNWVHTNGSIRYDLEAKTYNDLIARSNMKGTPLLLVLLCLPKSDSEWLETSPDKLVLRRCCFWHQLRGSPTLNTSSQRILIPITQQLDAQELCRLMELTIAGQLT